MIENWITLRAAPVKPGFTYVLMCDTVTVFEGTLDKSDTLIHDETLEPAVTYTYTAFAQKGKEKSKTVTAMATTMDTTSHDFTIEKFEWSGRGSSILWDVEIIKPNNIWAFGKIHTEDTDRWNGDSTKWITAYNAIHWDGNNWELRWVKSKICGTSTVDYPNLKGALKDTWGVSQQEVFVTGSKAATGTDNVLLHKKNGSWSFLDVPTEIDINDIWGSIDENTGQAYILLPLSFKWDTGEKKLLQLRPDNSIIEEYWPFSDRRLNQFGLGIGTESL